MKPVFEGPLNLTIRAKTRCAACQLQICKSRHETPHGALQEMQRDEAKNTAVFTCDTCGVSLVWSGDTNRPGWAQQRPDR
jgi:hypothetical protein